MEFLGTWVPWVQLEKPSSKILYFYILGRFQGKPMNADGSRDRIKIPILYHQIKRFLRRKKRLTRSYHDLRKIDDDAREKFDAGGKSGTSSPVEIEAITTPDVMSAKRKRKKKRAACRNFFSFLLIDRLEPSKATKSDVEKVSWRFCKADSKSPYCVSAAWKHALLLSFFSGQMLLGQRNNQLHT